MKLLSKMPFTPQEHSFMFSIKQLFIGTLFLSSALTGAQLGAQRLVAAAAAKKSMLTAQRSFSTQNAKPVDQNAELVVAMISGVGGGIVGGIVGFQMALANARGSGWQYNPARTYGEVRERHNVIFAFTYGGALTGGYGAMKLLEISPRVRVGALAIGVSLVALRACVRDSKEEIL